MFCYLCLGWDRFDSTLMFISCGRVVDSIHSNNSQLFNVYVNTGRISVVTAIVRTRECCSTFVSKTKCESIGRDFMCANNMSQTIVVEKIIGRFLAIEKSSASFVISWKSASSRLLSVKVLQFLQTVEHSLNPTIRTIEQKLRLELNRD